MHRWIIIGLALLLAAFGVTEGNDGIVAWVFDIVGNHPLTDIWQPVYNPEPMDTYAYRPLSVVLLKIAAALFGDHTMVWTAVHSLILVAYGLVSRVVPDDRLEAQLEMVRAALDKAPLPAVLAVKEYATNAITMSVEQASDFARNMHAAVNTSAGMRG